MSTGRTEVRGVTLAHIDVGDGPPCLVLHGFTGSHRAMRGLIDGLATDHRVIAPDLIGHGASDAPEDVAEYTLRAIVDQLEHLRVEVARAPVALVGYSFGARVALSYAVAHPLSVTRLVTIGGTAGIADADAAAARRRDDEAMAERIEREGVPAFVDRWEQAPIFSTQAELPAEVQAGIRAGRLANRAVGLANSLRGAGTGAMRPLWDDLSELGAPTTVVAGALDSKFVELGRDMVERLPDARLVTIEGAGHAAHLEAPEACLRVVRDALTRSAS